MELHRKSRIPVSKDRVLASIRRCHYASFSREARHLILMKRKDLLFLSIVEANVLHRTGCPSVVRALDAAA
jgi:hypothetical protein